MKKTFRFLFILASLGLGLWMMISTIWMGINPQIFINMGVPVNFWLIMSILGRGLGGLLLVLWPILYKRWLAKN